MSSFTEHSHIKPHGTKWINTKAFKFYLKNSMEGKYIEVPEDFVFDGCSVFCPFGQKIEPDTLTSCCLHDFMWSNNEYGFFESNYIFLVAMHVDGVSEYKRFKYFLGVNLFGWVIWFAKLWKRL